MLEGQTFTPCNTAANLNLRRELRLWANANGTAQQRQDMQLVSNIDMWRSDRSSIYHGLLTSIRGDIAGVNLNVNYTLSQVHERPRRRWRSPTRTSSPHNLETQGPRAVPAGPPPHLQHDGDRQHAAVRQPPSCARIASDWQLAVINRISSGAPQTIAAGTDRALTGLAGQVADQVSDDIFLDESGDLGSVRYNRAAFAAPALGTYGNAGFFSVPGHRHMDAGCGGVAAVHAWRRPAHRGPARGVQRAERRARDRPDRPTSRT